jgi:hypothetical protein
MGTRRLRPATGLGPPQDQLQHVRAAARRRSAGEGERLVGVRVARIDDATAELGVLAGSSPLPPRG